MPDSSHNSRHASLFSNTPTNPGTPYDPSSPNSSFDLTFRPNPNSITSSKYPTTSSHKPFVSRATADKFDTVFGNDYGCYDRFKLTKPDIKSLRRNASARYESSCEGVQYYTMEVELHAGYLAEMSGKEPADDKGREGIEATRRLLEDTRNSLREANEGCQFWKEILGLIDEMEEIRKQEKWC